MLNINYDKILNLFIDRWIIIEPWLSEEEIFNYESKYNFHFPLEYKNLIKSFIPTSKWWINRRKISTSNFEKLINWPIEWILFDVQYNWFRHSNWWIKPSSMDQILFEATKHLNLTPRLIPIYWHRYISQISWWPVLSIYQTDIVYYWCDLENYIMHELWYSNIHYNKIKVHIPFWTDLCLD